ncbi:MAG: DUF262 domain-containing protein [Vampirovibrionales bacterium]
MFNTTEDLKAINEQVKAKRKEIRLLTYPVGLGEIINLYAEDNAIDLKAKYHRFFRWTKADKCSFIESLLLGLPCPPIFVYIKEDTTWEVLDGVQRLSTIFEFVGKYKSLDNNNFKLEGLEELTSLNGKGWDELPTEVKLAFRHTRLEIVRLEPGTSPQIRLELFKRINTTGIPISRQEIRNCLLMDASEQFLDFLATECNSDAFCNLIGQSEKKLNERVDLDYLIRTFYYVDHVVTGMSEKERTNYSEGRQLDEFAVEQAKLYEQRQENAFSTYLASFKKVVALLDDLEPKVSVLKVPRKSISRAMIEQFFIALIIYDYQNPNAILTLSTETKNKLQQTIAKKLLETQDDNNMVSKTRPFNNIQEGLTFYKHFFETLTAG